MRGFFSRKGFLLSVLICMAATLAYSQLPSTLSFQGLYTDTTGVAKSDGSYSFTFKLYNVSTGGTALWTETKSLTVDDGIFNTYLGDTNPFGSNIDWQETYYIGVSVSPDPEMSPRVALAATPYSMQSKGVFGSNNVFPDSGSVGIGTDSPESKLDISQAIDERIITFGHPTDDGYNIHAYVRHVASRGIGLDFYSYDYNAGSPSTHTLMSFEPWGAVGIGHISPMAKLTVKGASSTSASYALSVMNSNNDTTLTVRDDKWVGINANSPEATFHVNHDYSNSLGWQNPNQEGLKIRNTNNADNNWSHIDFYDASGGVGAGIGCQYINQADDRAELAFATRDSNSFEERMRISEEGRIGIGTTSPKSKLHIHGGVVQLRYYSSYNTATTHNCLYMGLNTDTNNNGYTKGFLWHLDKNSTSEFYHTKLILKEFQGFNNTGDTGGNFLDTNWKETMTISNGKIGIGTTSPTVPLFVMAGGTEVSPFNETLILLQNNNLSTDNARLNIISGNTAEAIIDFGDAEDIDNGAIQYNHAVNQLQFGTAGVYDRMVLDSLGNVGIGTTNPVAGLHIDRGSTNELGLMITSSGAGWGSGLKLENTYSGTHTYGIYTANNGTLKFADVDEGQDRIVIDSTGKVGIGTTSPGYTLDINGTAWCTSGSWSGSDMRWKKNVKPLKGSLGKVLRLRGVSYNWKTDEFPEKNFDNSTQIGVIAQEVEKLYPELVITGADGYKGVAYEKFVPVLIEAIKEQQATIDELKGLIMELNNKINQLEKKE